MANTLNTAETAILQSAVQAYVSEIAPVQAFSLDADSGMPGQRGGSVIVKVATARTASLFSSSYESGDTTFTDKTVTLGHHCFTSFHLTDVEHAKHTFNIVEAAAMEAARATARNVFDFVSGIWTDGNYGSSANNDYLPSIAVTAFDADDVVDLGKLLDVDKVPSANRSLILTPAAHASLKKDNQLQDASASGSVLTLREGVTGRVDRFDVYMSSGINATALDSGNVYAFACHPTAMAVALRTVPPSDSDIAAAAGLRYGEMTDPASGITLGMRTWYNTATGTRWGAFECLAGRSVVQADGIARAKSVA